MKKVFITDWLDKFGGAEKVVQAICEIYSFDTYYAYTDQMPDQTKRKLFGKDVKIIFSPFLKMLGKHFRYAMPLFPFITKHFNKKMRKQEANLIISSSWVLSKSFKIPGAKHICYLQARNFKYVWDEADLYFTGIRKILSFTKGYLRRFDVEAAQNPDILISNSKFVQNWVKEHYNRDSLLVYPPVELDDFKPSSETADYYITVGRIEPYKRFDIIIEAFNKNGKKLIVIGSGSQLNYLKKIAKDNIHFPGFLPKDEFKNILNKAKGFVYAGIEDFGIAVVESLASGVPVIGYNGGAMPEIIENEKDGVLFDYQTPDSLNQAINYFETIPYSFNPSLLQKKAYRFSKKRFQEEIKAIINTNLME